MRVVERLQKGRSLCAATQAQNVREALKIGYEQLRGGTRARSALAACAASPRARSSPTRVNDSDAPHSARRQSDVHSPPVVDNVTCIACGGGQPALRPSAATTPSPSTSSSGPRVVHLSRGVNLGGIDVVARETTSFLELGVKVGELTSARSVFAESGAEPASAGLLLRVAGGSNTSPGDRSAAKGDDRHRRFPPRARADDHDFSATFRRALQIGTALPRCSRSRSPSSTLRLRPASAEVAGKPWR